MGFPVDAFRDVTDAEIVALHAAAFAVFSGGAGRVIQTANSGDVGVTKESLTEAGGMWAAIRWRMDRRAAATNRPAKRTIYRYS